MSKYNEYQNTDLWKKLDKILKDLEENSDIEITTKRDLVIGYICKKLQEDSQGY